MGIEMNRCATCKHWQDPNAAVRMPGAASHNAIGAGRGICMMAVGPDHNSAAMDDAVMFVQDGSDYSACLVTKAEFGCVLHEAKEPVA